MFCYIRLLPSVLANEGVSVISLLAVVLITSFPEVLAAVRATVLLKVFFWIKKHEVYETMYFS